MNLILNTHYKYDTFGRFYYLTEEGAQLVTGNDEIISNWSNGSYRLKLQGKILKALMSYAINDDQRIYKSKQDFVEYAQYTFTNKRNSVLKMLGEMAEWAFDSDGDLMVYEERNPMDAYNYLPITIRIEGRNSGMLDMSYVEFMIPEDEYQVGY